MICGLHPTIELMQNLYYDFHLVGSRLIGTARENSDWDFLVEYKTGSNIKQDLLELGFVQVTVGGSYTKDPDLMYHFQWTDKERLLPQIDVQVARRDVFKARYAIYSKLKSLSGYNRNCVADLVAALKTRDLAWSGLTILVKEISGDAGEV